jgi:hypothetical protein
MQNSEKNAALSQKIADNQYYMKYFSIQFRDISLVRLFDQQLRFVDESSY